MAPAMVLRPRESHRNFSKFAAHPTWMHFTFPYVDVPKVPMPFKRLKSDLRFVSKMRRDSEFL